MYIIYFFLMRHTNIIKWGKKSLTKREFSVVIRTVTMWSIKSWDWIVKVLLGMDKEVRCWAFITQYFPDIVYGIGLSKVLTPEMASCGASTSKKTDFQKGHWNNPQRHLMTIWGIGETWKWAFLSSSNDFS